MQVCSVIQGGPSDETHRVGDRSEPGGGVRVGDVVLRIVRMPLSTLECPSIAPVVRIDAPASCDVRLSATGVH